MDAFQAIVLGIVQGLTEFLPISSTGHLRIVPAFLGWDDPGAAFTAVTQLGTMAAVLLYFRGDLWRIASTWVRSLRDRELRGTLEARMGWYILRSEEHTSELQSRQYLVCRLLLEKKQTHIDEAWQ